MGQSYLKNAALLTGADVLLRLAGMGLRIYLANALGGEGMGLYQLVLAVYSLFVTLATAGVSVAATRLMAEELARSPAEARGMLHCLLLAGAGLGVLALAALGLRCLFVLPCLLVTASDSFQSAWCRAEKQKPEHRDRRRLMLCLFVLLTGTVAECALVPKLFALLLPRIA